MALDGEQQFVGREPAAIVGDQDPREPALVGLDLHARGAGVEGIFDELLDRARRALDHLAGGDAVDGLWRKAADGHDDSRRIGARARVRELGARRRIAAPGVRT